MDPNPFAADWQDHPLPNGRIDEEDEMADRYIYTQIADERARWEAELAANRALWERFHGRDELVEQLVHCAFALMEHRMRQDYGDDRRLAESPDAVDDDDDDDDEKAARDALLVVSTWWKENAAEVSDHLREESRYMDHATKHSWGSLLPGGGTESRPLPTPWHDDVDRAVAILDDAVTTRQLVWEIHEHAERLGARNRGVNALFLQGDWGFMATNILRDLHTLEAFPPPCPGRKQRMERTIEGFRDRFFSACGVRPDGLLEMYPRFKIWAEEMRKRKMDRDEALDAEYEDADRYCEEIERYCRELDKAWEASWRRRCAAWARRAVRPVLRRFRRLRLRLRNRE